MNILVACEESQVVTNQFRKIGHNAFSCDIIDHSGEHDDWHIKQDVLPLLNGNCTFNTVDGKEHTISSKWDMIIAFPPCTDLCVSGARHFEKKRENGSQKKSIEFFMNFLNADCEKIMVENPVGIISGNYISKYYPDLQEKYNFPIKYQQIIQPYEHGDKASKTTCLWLKGLPLLKPIRIVDKGEFIEWVDKKTGKTKRQTKWYMTALKSGNDRAKIRSRTFIGIANAIASQYGF